MPSSAEPLYRLTHIDEIDPVSCPCGSARRAFMDDPDRIASLHLVESDGEAKCHYHKRMTEIYYILDGEGQIELDGNRFEVSAGSTVLIKPGCRHRLIGALQFINVPIPAFDPNDEFFD